MSIIELLQKVGAENVKVQRVDASITQARRCKGGHSALTIETTEFDANDLMALSCGKRPRNHGLIVWIPSDKLPPIEGEGA